MDEPICLDDENIEEDENIQGQDDESQDGCSQEDDVNFITDDGEEEDLGCCPKSDTNSFKKLNRMV